MGFARVGDLGRDILIAPSLPQGVARLEITRCSTVKQRDRRHEGIGQYLFIARMQHSPLYGLR